MDGRRRQSLEIFKQWLEWFEEDLLQRQLDLSIAELKKYGEFRFQVEDYSFQVTGSVIEKFKLHVGYKFRLYEEIEELPVEQKGVLLEKLKTMFYSNRKEFLGYFSSYPDSTPSMTWRHPDLIAGYTIKFRLDLEFPGEILPPDLACRCITFFQHRAMRHEAETLCNISSEIALNNPAKAQERAENARRLADLVTQYGGAGALIQRERELFEDIIRLLLQEIGRDNINVGFYGYGDNVNW